MLPAQPSWRFQFLPQDSISEGPQLSPGASGVEIRYRNGSIFDLVRSARALATQLLRSAFRPTGANVLLTSGVPHGTRKTIKKRSAGTLARAQRHKRARQALRGVLGLPQGRSRGVPGQTWAAPGRPKSALGASRACFWASRGRPGDVPGCARSGPGRPGWSNNAFGRIWVRFWLDFRLVFKRFVVDCQSIFLLLWVISSILVHKVCFAERHIRIDG